MNDSSNDVENGSMNVIANCNPGDVVWVNTEIGGLLRLNLENNQFSGYLLHRL